MTRNWMAPATEGRLLDELATRRQRLSAARSSVTPQMGQLASSYADAYPWMEGSAVQSLVQAGLSPDLPSVQSIADQAARQAAEDGEFTEAAEDVPDAWYESLWNAATGWTKPIVRTGFTILATPFEEIQALLSSAGTALLDETEAGEMGLLSNFGENISALLGELGDPGQLIDDFWTNYTEKAARSSGLLALGDLLKGETVHLGEGFLPGQRFDPETGEELDSIFAERQRDKYRLQLDGQFVTPGRLLARTMVEPGTGAYQVLSGAYDFVQNIALDPVALGTAGLSKAAKAHRTFRTIGAIPGVRKSVDVPTAVNHFLTQPQGQQLVRMWTENTDVATAFKSLGSPDLGGMGMEAARKLAATTDEAQTFRVLAGGEGEMGILGAVVRERPSQRFVKKTLERGMENDFGAMFGHGARVAEADTSRIGFLARAGRLGEDLPTGPINARNVDNAAVQLDRWMVNAQIPEAFRNEVIGELASVTGRASFEEVAETAAKTVSRFLENEWGVSAKRARELTSLFDDTVDGLRVFDLDDVGNHADVLKPLRPMVDGQQVDLSPMPAMIAELADDIMLPSVKEIRRITPVVKELQGLYDSGLWKGTIDGIRAVQTAAWMPLNLLRNALTIRVVGDGQARMAGAGYDSLFNHPMDSISWFLGADPNTTRWRRFQQAITSDKNPVTLKPKGTHTVSGQDWEDFAWFTDSMERGSGGWRGYPGEIVSGNYVKAKYGQPGFYEGWADKMSHMANDPVYRRVAGGLTGGDLRSIGRTSKASRPTAGAAVTDIADELATRYGGDSFAFHVTGVEEAKSIKSRGFRQGGLYATADEALEAAAQHGDDAQVVIFQRNALSRSLREELESVGRVETSMVRGSGADDDLVAAGMSMFGEPLQPDNILAYKPGAAAQPVSPQAAAHMQGVSFDDVAEWFWSGTGKNFRKELASIEGRSALLTREGADGYLQQNFFDQLERVTKGDPDLVNMVATGQLDKISLRASGHKTSLTKVLSESYDHAAPDWIGTPLRMSKGRRNQAGEAFNHLMEAGFEKFLTNPENFLTKSPTFRQMYFERVEEVIGLAPRALQEEIVKGAKAAGMDDGYLARLATQMLKGEGDRLTKMSQVEQLAGGWAFSETRKLLYNLADRNQFMDMMKVIWPFGDVFKNVITSWAGIVRQNPQVLRRFQQGLNGARQPSVFGEAETTQGTGEGFFHRDPQTGDEVFTYPLLGKLATGMLGMPEGSVDFVGRTAGLNLATSTVLPGFGPAVSIPASHLIPNTPQWDTVRDIILPFGEQESIVEALTPRWAQNMKEFFSEPDPDKNRLFSNTVVDVMRALAPNHDLSTPEGQQTLLDEATAKAKQLYVIRGIAQFNVPTGPSLQWNAEDVQGNLIPVKILSDDLRALTEEYGGDRQAAFSEWVKKYGVDNLLSVMPKTTSIVERPVTEKGDAWLRAHPELERDFSMTVGFFAPEPAVGEFDYTAYLRQLDEGAREGISPAEQLALANDFLGRIQFEQAKKIAEFRSGPESSAWLAQVREQIAEEYPGFDGWVSRAVWEKKPKPDELITEIRSAVQNPDIARTDAGQGTILYLSAVQMAEAMVTRLPGNVKHYQQAKSARPIRDWLRSVAREIASQHPDFARVWGGVFERELADDQLAA